jgi:hypothetical protein
MMSIIVAAAAALAVSAAVPVASAGQPPTNANEHHTMEQHHRQMMQAQGGSDAATPTVPGQDAFGAIQEVVRILEADPNTDWSKVNLEALRQHLIDMNEVTLRAKVVTKPIEGGIEARVTGEGRTTEAIRRMVVAHAQQIDRSHLNGWSAKTEPLTEGVVLTVTSSDPQGVQHIRGLGFIGVMVSGSHHQPHHLGMAKGDFVHSQ